MMLTRLIVLYIYIYVQANIHHTVACENTRFSSLFADGDVSRRGIGLRHRYGISAAESQTFLLAKRPRRRRARRNGCFRRLTTLWTSRYIERCQTEETEARNAFQYNLIPDCYSSKRSITASLRTGGISKKVSPGTRISPATQDRSRRPYVIWEKWSQLLDLALYVWI